MRTTVKKVKIGGFIIFGTWPEEKDLEGMIRQLPIIRRKAGSAEFAVHIYEKNNTEDYWHFDMWIVDEKFAERFRNVYSEDRKFSVDYQATANGEELTGEIHVEAYSSTDGNSENLAKDVFLCYREMLETEYPEFKTTYDAEGQITQIADEETPLDSNIITLLALMTI